ncbi:MAG TPA: DUF2877 domain-containing protein [Anaerolineales bacterium]
MILRVISIGDAVPRADFDATVHSVFREAANLRLVPDGSLVTVVAATEADLPQGIRVDTPIGFSFETLQVGLSVACREDSLQLGSLRIALRGARRWKCDLPALQADLASPTVSAAWILVWQALGRRQEESNADIIATGLLQSEQVPRSGVAERAGQAMGELIDATRQEDLPRAVTSARALIGLGHGLTPSGDDLLVGFLAGLWCGIGNDHEVQEFVTSLGQAIVASSTETNEISRAYLAHAALGQVSSRLADLAEAICKGIDSSGLLERATVAMQVGHTSGMDAVTGLLLGLAAWDRRSLKGLELG